MEEQMTFIEADARDIALRCVDQIQTYSMSSEEIVELLISIYGIGYYNGFGAAMRDGIERDAKVLEFIKGKLTG